MVSLIPDESLSRLKSLFGEKFNQFTKVEVQALVTADLEGHVDNARLRQVCDVHTADLTRLFQSLVAGKALIQEGQGRWSRYRLPSGPQFSHTEVHSPHREGGSPHNAGDSLHKMPELPHQSAASVHIVDDNVMMELLPIAERARNNRRLKPEDMERIILQLCRDRWLSRSQLAELLQRNPDGLLSRYLKPRVRHGYLQMRYPQTPNRVDQAYKASEEDGGDKLAE